MTIIELLIKYVIFRFFKTVPIGLLYQQFLWNSIYLFIQLVSPAYIVH